jgi:hypothetical protein
VARFFGKKFLKIKRIFWFCLHFFSEAFLIIKTIQRDIVINVSTTSCKVPVISVRVSWDVKFLDRFSEKTFIRNFMKISPMGAEVFLSDGQTDTPDEADSHSSLATYLKKGKEKKLCLLVNTGRFVSPSYFCSLINFLLKVIQCNRPPRFLMRNTHTRARAHTHTHTHTMNL